MAWEAMTVRAADRRCLAQASLNGVADGLLFGNPGHSGHPRPFGQLLGVIVVYSGAMTFVLLKLDRVS